MRLIRRRRKAGVGDPPVSPPLYHSHPHAHLLGFTHPRYRRPPTQSARLPAQSSEIPIKGLGLPIGPKELPKKISKRLRTEADREAGLQAQIALPPFNPAPQPGWGGTNFFQQPVNMKDFIAESWKALEMFAVKRDPALQRHPSQSIAGYVHHLQVACGLSPSLTSAYISAYRKARFSPAETSEAEFQTFFKRFLYLCQSFELSEDEHMPFMADASLGFGDSQPSSGSLGASTTSKLSTMESQGSSLSLLARAIASSPGQGVGGFVGVDPSIQSAIMNSPASPSAASNRY